MKVVYIFCCCLLTLCGSLFSYSETKIDFENPESFKSLGMYDAWEDSPFRSGELEGNFAIVSNPDLSVNNLTGEISNPSSLVLGAQRSRFASNRFGVRVDLEKPFELSPSPKYAHIFIHKPLKGRVMLIGLGSRKERLDQDPFTEQFMVLSSFNVEINKWSDAVFILKGAQGVEIRSLVIIPDCESPHNLDSDFLFYLGNIEINDDPKSRIINEFYPVTGLKDETLVSKTKPSAKSISLTVNNQLQLVDINQSEDKKLYQNRLDEFFYAKPGDIIAPEIEFDGKGMHSYCYIDIDQDGQFSYNLNADGTPADELVTYNYYNGYNSDGKELSSPNLGNNCGKMPSFKLPDDLQPGIYRIRFKLDKDCIDPKGNSENGNSIVDNGGVIADAILCVFSDTVEINDFQLNGEILAEDGSKLNFLKVKADKEYAVKSLPEKGFINGGMIIKQGYNLSSENLLDRYGNPQYKEFLFSPEDFNADNILVLPANVMRANILINGIMTEQKSDQK